MDTWGRGCLLAHLALATTAASVAGCVDSSTYDNDARGAGGTPPQNLAGSAGAASSAGNGGVAAGGCGGYGGYGDYGGKSDYWRCIGAAIDAGSGGVGGVSDLDLCFGGYAG